ncbi:MAG: hypothetical protein IKF01_00805 [Bacilli bacterium]|nr:hypothetical protein [Bacilli bacterium]
MNIERIKKGYVADDCLQYMEGTREDNLTVISDKIVFNMSKEITHDSYKDDRRRFAFPYYNIPSHIEKDIDGKIHYINQLYDFNKKYIVIKDGHVFIKLALKDEKTKEGILISKLIKPELYGGSKFKLTKYNLINLIKAETRSCIAVLSQKGELLDIDREMENVDTFEKKVLYIKSNGKSLNVNSMKIMRDNNKLGLIILKYPVNDFSFDDIDYSDSTEYVSEPKIKRRLNPSISKDAIISSKTMSRMLNN